MRTILRKAKEKLTDAQKYQILLQYSKGIPVTEIARGLDREKHEISSLIQGTLKGMNTIRETNDLLVGTHSAALKKQIGANPTKFLTSAFLTHAEDHAEMYAYYYAQTGDNKFAIIQSGLNVGISKNVTKTTKDYVYRIRGQFLRDIPQVAKIIRDEQDKRIREYNVEKPQVQMELVNQIEQLKEVVTDDPRQRSNLLKAIELLGRSIGAFTDRVEYEEADAKSGLQILMEKATKEAKGVIVYEPKE